MGRLGSLLRLMGTSCIIRNGPEALLHFDLVPKMAPGSILWGYLSDVCGGLFLSAIGRWCAAMTAFYGILIRFQKWPWGASPGDP